MKTKHPFIWLRITFWWGMIADLFETIRMVFPDLFLATTGINLVHDIGLKIGLLYGAPVMLGWTILLFWADRNPLERKGVVICLIPVILSYIGVEIVLISLGIVSIAKVSPTFFLQAVLIGLCLFSYKKASEPAHGK